MEVKIELKNIEKKAKEKNILTDINARFYSGECTAILGGNGAGKSSLLKIILQLSKKSSGNVFFDNQPFSEKNLQQMGYLPEERGLYPEETAYKQLDFLAALRGISPADRKEKIDFWLDRFEIGTWKDRKIKHLSKGMAQKIQLIAALLHEPAVLLLDEPFSGLDPKNLLLFEENLMFLKQKGTTLLLAAHHLTTVENLADQIIFLEQGKIIKNEKLTVLYKEYPHKNLQMIFLELLKNEK